jgi:crotonobetainyl-CoA:carnitine CoA-transferase CaiB-like acyl-CoA transferase
MVRTALCSAAEQIVEYSANDVLLAREGNRGPEGAPQGLYRCVDDPDATERWVAIAVEDDAQWARFLHTVDAPEWMRDAELGSAGARRSRADDLDAWIATWARARAGDLIVEQLWAAGVPAAKLLMPHEQTLIPQLAVRGFWQEIDHPVAGRTVHAGFPIRFSSGSQVCHRSPPPTLGQHNHEILTKWLGLSDDQVAGLAAGDVIGNQPGGKTRLM